MESVAVEILAGLLVVIFTALLGLQIKINLMAVEALADHRARIAALESDRRHRGRRDAVGACGMG